MRLTFSIDLSDTLLVSVCAEVLRLYVLGATREKKDQILKAFADKLSRRETYYETMQKNTA